MTVKNLIKIRLLMWSIVVPVCACIGFLSVIAEGRRAVYSRFDDINCQIADLNDRIDVISYVLEQEARNDDPGL